VLKAQSILSHDLEMWLLTQFVGFFRDQNDITLFLNQSDTLILKMLVIQKFLAEKFTVF
jgi:hypothetical protein